MPPIWVAKIPSHLISEDHWKPLFWFPQLYIGGGEREGWEKEREREKKTMQTSYHKWCSLHVHWILFCSNWVLSQQFSNGSSSLVIFFRFFRDPGRRVKGDAAYQRWLQQNSSIGSVLYTIVLHETIVWKTYSTTKKVKISVLATVTRSRWSKASSLTEEAHRINLR